MGINILLKHDSFPDNNLHQSSLTPNIDNNNNNNNNNSSNNNNNIPRSVNMISANLFGRKKYRLIGSMPISLETWKAFV